MNILTWNIRGLNGRSKQRILQNCIKTEDPDILLLQETKCGENRIRHTQKMLAQLRLLSLRFKRCCRGAFHLMEPCHSILDQGFSTPSTLTTHYQAIGSNKDGMITNAYGPQNIQDKDLFIQSLAYLGTLADHKPWIIERDFNMILTLEEKRGGGEMPGTRYIKIPGTHRSPQIGRHREWQWHLHLDQQTIRAPTNRLQARPLPYLRNSPFGRPNGRIQHPPEGGFRPLACSSLG
jgi:hypothetical protein